MTEILSVIRERDASMFQFIRKAKMRPRKPLHCSLAQAVGGARPEVPRDQVLLTSRQDLHTAFTLPDTMRDRWTVSLTRPQQREDSMPRRVPEIKCPSVTRVRLKNSPVSHNEAATSEFVKAKFSFWVWAEH